MTNTYYRVAISFLLKSVNALAVLMVTTLVTNRLPINDSASFFLFMAIFGLLSVFFRFGSDNVTIFYSATLFDRKDKKKLNLLLGSYLALIFSLYLLSLLVAFLSIVIFGIDNDSYIYILIMLTSSLFGAATLLVSFIFQGLKKSSLSIIFSGLSSSLFLLIFILVFSIESINSILLSILFSWFFSFFAAMAALKESQISVDYSLRYLKFFLGKAKRFIPASVLFQLNAWAPIFTMSFFGSAMDASATGVMLRISMSISFVLVAVSSVFSKNFANLFKKKAYKKLRLALKASIYISAIFSILVFLSVYLFRFEILSLFGVEYINYSKELIFIIFAQLINSLFGPMGLLLNVSGFYMYTFRSNFISLIIYIFILIILSQFYNMMISMIAALILGELTKNILNLLQLNLFLKKAKPSKE